MERANQGIYCIEKINFKQDECGGEPCTRWCFDEFNREQ